MRPPWTIVGAPIVASGGADRYLAPSRHLGERSSCIAIVWLVDLEVQRRGVLHMHDVLAESAEDSSPSGEERVSGQDGPKTALLAAQ